jgi:predicted hydrocarbon binding protein
LIRDTFETNPGLCELFKRKILERARFVGLSEDSIDFQAQIDKKGTYQDNLRAFYREYPQLSQNSDYFRIKSVRPLSGAALEQSWRGYERSNGHEISELTREPTEELLTSEPAMPESVITFAIGGESVTAQKEASIESQPISAKSIPQQAKTSRVASTHRELLKSDWLAWTSTITELKAKPIEKLERQEQDGWILEDGERILSFRVGTFQSIHDCVTAMVGEKVSKIILHQIGQEIGKTSFNYSRDQIPSDNPVEALDHVLSVQGWGRVLDLDKTDHGPSVTYACSVKGCPLCPTCDIMRGILSGWLESFVQKKPENIENACMAKGSQPCVFRVTFRK